MGQREPYGVGVIGDHAAQPGQRQRVAADAAAQVQHGAGRRIGVDPGGAVGGDGVGRGLFQRLGGEKEPVGGGELGRGAATQPGQRSQCACLLRREAAAQVGQQAREAGVVQRIARGV